MWSKCGLADPFKIFDPKIPEKFKQKNCFCARYNRQHHSQYMTLHAYNIVRSFTLCIVCRYMGSEDKDTFFSSGQRSAIVSQGSYTVMCLLLSSDVALAGVVLSREDSIW